MKLTTVFLVTGFLILNLLSDSVFAQVEIGPDDIPTEAGSIFPFYVAADPEGIEVDLGFSGEAREWDFTNYDFDEVEYDSLIASEDAPNGEDFEEANRISLSSGGGIALNFGDNYQYELVSENGWYLLGTGFGGGNFGFPLIFPEPILLLPLPAEFDEEWDMTGSFSYGMVAPDTLLGGILDSLYIVVEVGGHSEIDAWGTVIFPSGEIETMRQHVLLSVDIFALGVAHIMGRRMEFPIDLGLSTEPTHSYRWFAQDHGLLVEINSLPGEEEENFDLAASIRVRFLAPELTFQEAPLNFGEVWPGGHNGESFAIENNGDGDGRIMRIEVAEEYAMQITWDVELPYTINPEEEAEINFTWQPLEVGVLETDIEIFHNDPAVENPLVLAFFCYSLLHVEEEKNLMTDEFTLLQNFPNPFNSTTTIRYSLPLTSHVSLAVYDLAGQQISTLFEGTKQPGIHSTNLTANNLPSGLYFVRLKASDQVFTKKVMLIR
ncbi:MAG: T9SS type A sorting domain-containing protein [Calditrichaeota bacterium]|nr:T9SS type A sorting domain-containing protein [Calditrichota bacterium]